MKKIIAIVAALVIVLGVFAACTNNPDANVTEAPETTVPAPTYADAVEVLTTIFAAYGEDNKFPVCGGDENNENSMGPGKYDYTLTDELNGVAKLPLEQASNIEDAATALHMMNLNSFTGAAYKVADGTDLSAFAADFKAELDGTRWMCGFPEKFIVIKTGNYVITAYGVADIMDYFKTTASEALTGSEVVLEGNIEG